MPYSIVNNNNSEGNHFSRIISAFTEAEEIIIASPFLMDEFAGFLSGLKLKQLRAFTLITTLKPNDPEQLQKIPLLDTLFQLFKNKYPLVIFSLLIHNRLHGKLYCFKKGSHYSKAIISSANFTNNGLKNNLEWGLEVTDATMVQSLYNSLMEPGYYTLESTQLIEMHKRLAALNKDLQWQPQKFNHDLVSNFLYNEDSFNADTYWLKPIGVTGDPVPLTRKFNTPTEELYFSTRRPSGVKPGHIIITYGVGSTKILSVYRVTSEVYELEEEELNEYPRMKRWPYYVIGRNLTPVYGNHWSRYNLFYNVVREEYLQLSPRNVATLRGNKKLGTLNRGADRVKLDPGFAQYLISKVVALNRPT